MHLIVCDGVGIKTSMCPWTMYLNTHASSLFDIELSCYGYTVPRGEQKKLYRKLVYSNFVTESLKI